MLGNVDARVEGFVICGILDIYICKPTTSQRLAVEGC